MLAQRPVRKTGNVDGRAAVTRFRCYAARGRAAFPPDLAELGSGGDGGDERDCSRRPPPSVRIGRVAFSIGSRSRIPTRRPRQD
jgi:hypothetical protein